MERKEEGRLQLQSSKILAGPTAPMRKYVSKYYILITCSNKYRTLGCVGGGGVHMSPVNFKKSPMLHVSLRFLPMLHVVKK